jgi:hypothetical protein
MMPRSILVDEVVHYRVTNMPGAVGRTSTYALTNVTLPYLLQMARKGVARAFTADEGLATASTCKAVASPMSRSLKRFESAFRGVPHVRVVWGISQENEMGWRAFQEPQRVTETALHH